MSQHEETYELIERYLRNDLSDKERLEFEERVSTDKVFARNVKLQKAAQEATIIHGLKDIKSMMDHDLKKAGSGGHRKWLYIALPVIGLITWVSLELLSVDDPEIRPTTTTNTEQAIHESSEPKENRKMDSSKQNPSEKPLKSQPTESNQVVVTEPKDKSISIDTTIVADYEQNELERKKESKEVDSDVEAQQETTAHKTIEDICLKTTIRSTLYSVNPKFDEEYGYIQVSKRVNGGTFPYQFALSNGKFQTENVFKKLSPGTYTVIVKDANGCVDTLGKRTIIKELCNNNYKQTFSPGTDFEWLIPSAPNKTGRFKLYSKSRTVLVDIELKGNNDEVWSGFDKNNSEVPSGFYRFVIEYSDNTTCPGSLSVIQ